MKGAVMPFTLLLLFLLTGLALLLWRYSQPWLAQLPRSNDDFVFI
jgi:hypothetical protein